MDIEQAIRVGASLAQFAREAAAGAELAWQQIEQSGVLFEAVRHARRSLRFAGNTIFNRRWSLKSSGFFLTTM